MSRIVKPEEYMTYDKCIRDDTKTSDCVSREAVVYYIQSHIQEIITESGIDKNARTNTVLRAVVNGVKAMPSVQPTADLSAYSDKLWKQAYERGKAARPKGEWIRRSIQSADCSVCGHIQTVYGQDLTGKCHIHKALFKFCPNCGAKMEGVSE